MVTKWQLGHPTTSSNERHARLARARAIAEAVDVHAVAQLRGEGDRVHPRGEHHLAAHLGDTGEI